MSGDREKLRNEELDVSARQGKKDDGEQLGADKSAEEDQSAVMFSSMVGSMAKILGESPTFEVPEFATPELEASLEQLFAAKTATMESVGAGHVSGIARMKALNLGLANLRPVLAAGLKPGQADPTRAFLGERVTELRHEIKQTIYKEAVPRQKRKVKDEDEDAGDEDEPDEDSDVNEAT